MSYGLVYPPDFLASLNSLLDRPKPFPPVRALSDLQFIQVHAKHLLQMGSQGIDSTLFPYLHGIEYGGPNIREYFCRSHKNSSCIHPSLANPSNAGEGGGPDSTCPSCSRLLCVPDYRGLIWVSDDGNEDIDDDGLEDEMLVDDDELDFSRPSDLSIQSSPSSYSLLRKSTSASIIPSLASRTVTSLKTTMSDDSTADTYSSQTLAMMHIRGSFKVPEILSSSENRFVIPKPPDGVSLRNFEIQVSAYARVSDVILYSSRGRGITSSLLSLANRFCEAHEALYRERSNQGQNPPLYNVFLLDCIPSQLPRHFLCSYPSFADIERREMQTFTSASQILPGIFLGNSADVPSWSNSECTTNVFENKNNPHGYDLVVECVDEKLVAIPTSSHIKKAEDHLSTLQSLWATGFMSTPPQRPPPNAHSILHLLFPCSPSAQTPLQHIIAFISFIQSLIHPVHGSRRCKILIYCQDGYTETSVLALTLLMAERKCSLPEAYLDLQTKKDRSFFVHGSDIPLLQKLQGKYHSSPQFGSLGRSALGWSRNRERDRWPWSGFGKSDHSGPSEKEGIGSLGIKFGRRSSSQLNGSPRENHGIWFQNPKFDGSLPSRILPFLYLGNLNHAQNAQMLHSLDITHVVSVGESALVPPDDPSSSGAFTLWSEEREGRLKVLDVKNILDDGMDGLGGQLSPICDWMDEARKSGGKVLVHCRVGVSRSATVTIAYVMRHLSLSLADAYLLVRSRRLSVLIQPNIRLLFDLLGWEVHLARERIKSKLGRLPMDWPMMEQDSAIINTVEEMVLMELNQALCWPYLAREIYKLNAKYIR